MERQFLLRTILAPRKTARRAVGKINRPIRFDDNIVWTSEPLSLVAIRQYGVSAIFLDSLNGPIPRCIHQESVLPVEREAVGPIEACSFRVHRSGTRGILITRVFQIHRQFSSRGAGITETVRRPLIDTIPRDIAEQEISGLALLNPHRPFPTLEA